MSRIKEILYVMQKSREKETLIATILNNPANQSDNDFSRLTVQGETPNYLHSL